MRFLGKNEKNDDFYFVFKGMVLSRHETKKLSFGFLSGGIGIVILLILPFHLNRYANFLFLSLFFFIGYFIIAPKFYKGKPDDNTKKRPKIGNKPR